MRKIEVEQLTKALENDNWERIQEQDKEAYKNILNSLANSSDSLFSQTTERKIIEIPLTEEQNDQNEITEGFNNFYNGTPYQRDWQNRPNRSQIIIPDQKSLSYTEIYYRDISEGRDKPTFIISRYAIIDGRVIAFKNWTTQ